MNRVAFWFNRSLRRKLLLLPLLLGVAITAVTVWGIHAEFQNQMLERVRLRGELVANLVNYAAESVSRPGELQRIVAAIGADEDVALIVVVGGHPARVLASTRYAWLGKTLAELPIKEVGEDLEKAIQTRQSHHHVHLESAMFDFTAPLLLSQPDLADRSLTDGAVMVHLDMRPTQVTMRRLTIALSAAFLAVLVILAGVGYGLIRHFILRPVARIGTLVQLRPADDDESWAEIATDDELGTLARTLHDSLTRTGALLHEVKEQKNALRVSEERYRTLFEHSSDAIVLLEASGPEAGRILDANECTATLHGYTLAHIKTLNIRDLDVPTDAALVEERLRLLRETGQLHFEVEHRRKDSSVFPVEVSAKLVNLGGQQFVLSVNRDITARKQAEGKLHDQLIELQRWQEVMLGRENRVSELKREVNELLLRQNQPPRYSHPDAP